MSLVSNTCFFSFQPQVVDGFASLEFRSSGVPRLRDLIPSICITLKLPVCVCVFGKLLKTKSHLHKKLVSCVHTRTRRNVVLPLVRSRVPNSVSFRFTLKNFIVCFYFRTCAKCGFFLACDGSAVPSAIYSEPRFHESFVVSSEQAILGTNISKSSRFQFISFVLTTQRGFQQSTELKSTRQRYGIKEIK